MLMPRSRTTNVFALAGKPLVARVPHFNGDYLPDTVGEAVKLLGGLERAIRPGDRVVIKPNFNCSFELPLSTDRAFLAAAIELLQAGGASVTVAELSGKAAWPTERVVNDLQILPLLARYGVPFVDLEFDQWLPMQVGGRHWHSFRVPRTLYEAEKRVYLANMRWHSSARFSCSLKLSVGWIDLQDRAFLHADRSLTEARVAELNLGWQPDLVLIDGRRTTAAANGRGPYIYPNVVLASGDMVAIDAAAVAILQQYPGSPHADVPPAEMGQLATAQAHGLGSLDYTLVEGQAHTQTIQEGMPETLVRY